MSTLTLRVPDDLNRALERQSAALGISKSDLAREALKRYLRVAEFRTLRTRLVARAQAGGINTADDVFEVLQKKGGLRSILRCGSRLTSAAQACAASCSKICFCIMTWRPQNSYSRNWVESCRRNSASLSG